MNFATKILATTATTIVLAVAMVTVSGAPAQAGYSSWNGCPSGAACLFSGTSESNPGQIQAIWWEDAYNLNNVWGVHLIYNNQTDDWQIDLCEGWYGYGPAELSIGADNGWAWTMDSINSVYLHPSDWRTCR